MKVLVILNGVSRKKQLFYSKIYPRLKERLDVDLWETQYAGHAEELATTAATNGFDVILSAGGDGTMHHVINGVMNSGRPAPLLGLIPIGSGNDLARATGSTPDAERIIDLIEKRQSSLLDLGLVTAQDKNQKRIQRYFINECSMGMGPEVVRRVNEGGRFLGAGFMYLKAIVATFFLLKPETIQATAVELKWSGKSRVMAVANGKAFGHGIYIAPQATMQDGLLNVFIAGNPPLVRFLMLLQVLRRPRESRDACLTYAMTTRISVSGEKPLPVEADGEMVGFCPMTCEVASKKVNFLR